MKIGGFLFNDLQGFQNLVGFFYIPTRSEKDLAGFEFTIIIRISLILEGATYSESFYS